jgi:photosystem II stability/assembly factor-like uncharacterized protein
MTSNRIDQSFFKIKYLLITFSLILFAQINAITFNQFGNYGTAKIKNIEKNGAVVTQIPVAGFNRPSNHQSPDFQPLMTDSGFTWHLQGTFSNTVFTDLSFADDSVGYASAELGIVYKTTNSGTTWARIMNLGFPYYWYGVYALKQPKVIVTGFNNTAGTGIYRWSNNGGTTWDSIVTLDSANWFSRVRFADSVHGIISAGWNGGVWRTVNGGSNPGNWNYVQVDPSLGWFAGNFTFRNDSNCYLTGISFCHSSDWGVNWSVQHSADPVFDGGVSFPDTLHGWTGGGQISAPVMGWIHRTTDGGITWSDRLIETPEPIRAVLFINDTVGFAVGGNHFTGVGAIYSTTNEGDSWRIDINTGVEMQGIDYKMVGDSVDVWCAGFNSSLTGCVYKTRVGLTRNGIEERQTLDASQLTPEIYPNPSKFYFTIRFPKSADCQEIKIFNASGKLISKIATPSARNDRIIETKISLKEINPGIYFLKLGNENTIKKLLVAR